jgi:hypothetical protein
MGGARMVEEVGELELEDELPKGKLQESRDVKNGRMSRWWEGSLSYPCIEFGARACTKKKVLLTEGS